MPIPFPACPTSGATPYVFPRSRYIASGDSITATNFGFDSHADWTAARAGLTLTNLGTNTYQAADADRLLTQVRIKGGDVTTILIGANDHTYYGTDANKRQVYKDSLRAMVYWAATTDKQKIRMQDVRLTNQPATILRVPTLLNTGGTTPYWGWANITGSNIFSTFGLLEYGDSGSGGNLAIGTVTNSSGLSMTLNGTSVWLSVGIHVGSTTQYTITIDGVSQGTFTAAANNAADFTTYWPSYTWAQRLHRFSGLSSGDHTVVIQAGTNLNGASSQLLAVFWAGGNGWNDPGAQPKVIVGTITNLTSYTAPDSAANVTAYNVDVNSVVQEAQADGHNVVLVDTRNAISTATDYRDSSHPNAGGQYKLSSAFMQEVVRP